MALVAAAIAVVAVVAALKPESRPITGPRRLSVVPPEGTRFAARDINWHPQFALSPDGLRIAFIAERPGERPQLWVHSLELGGARPLPGTDGASAPFWAPDGRQIGFFALGKLKKVSLEGTRPVDLANVPVDVTSGSWGTGGSIMFGGPSGGGLHLVPEDGGAATAVTTPDSTGAEIAHNWAQFLPDGRRFIYYARSRTPENSGVYLGSLDREPARLIRSSLASAVFVEPDQLLFELNGNLVRQTFDVEAGELMGKPVSLGDRVHGLFGPAFLPLSASRGGTLAYWNGSPPATALLWMDRSGRVLDSLPMGERVRHMAPSLSRDGTRLLVTRHSGPNQQDLWTMDLAVATPTRVAYSSGLGRFGIWSPDGAQIAFSAFEGGVWRLLRKAAGGAGDDVLLPTPARWAKFAEDWSRDGRWLLYCVSGGRTSWDIWTFDLRNDRSEPLLVAEGNQIQPRLSPDGRWLAYASDDEGAFEVHVRPLPSGAGQWQVSTAGGSQPTWREDGRELFYLDAEGRMVAVQVSTGAPFSVGGREPLFHSRMPPTLAPFRTSYDVTADGERFLVNSIVADPESTPITVLVNWRAAGDVAGRR